MNSVCVWYYKCADCKHLHATMSPGYEYRCGKMISVDATIVHRAIGNIQKIPDWCPIKYRRYEVPLDA